MNPPDQYVDPDDLLNNPRPNCKACGDPATVIYHNGQPMYAGYCRECYQELRYGVIPKFKPKRTF